MKANNFRYLIGEGFKNTWVNRLMTLASIGVLVACMVVIGLAQLISKNISVALHGLEEQNVIMAFMKDENWFIYGEEGELASITEETETSVSESAESGDAEKAFTITNDDEYSDLQTQVAALKSVSGCVKIAFPADYARKYMSDEVFERYQKLAKENNDTWPRGLLIEKVNADEAENIVAEIKKLPGVGEAYYNASEGGIAIYADDEAWAKGQTASAVSGADANQPDFYINSDEEGEKLCEQIRKMDNIKSVEFISSNKGFDEAIQYMTDTDKKYFEGLKEKGENPISCAAKITMKDMAKFDNTVKTIEKMPEISGVRSHRDLAQKIESIQKGVTFAGFGIMAILIIIALVIVSNTIRITMDSRKLEISIMKAVGATNSFIRIPFVVEGMLIGIFSAVISEVAVYFCYRVATETISDTLGGTVVPFDHTVILQLGAIFLAIGIATGIFGSFFMIRKYLRREGSRFL